MQKKEEKPKSRWIIQSFAITFTLSLVMSYITTNGMSNLNIFFAILILIAVIFVGILTDIIVVAVTVADEAEFHDKATKKVKGSKTSIKLIKNLNNSEGVEKLLFLLPSIVLNILSMKNAITIAFF